MTVVFLVLVGLVAVAGVVAIALVAVGREVAILEARVEPSVFELEEAVVFIAARLPDDITARISHDDVRWVLRVDAEVLEEATAEEVATGDADVVVDEVDAVARVLGRVGEERPDLTDADVVAVLDARTAYLEAIGAIGAPADPLDPPAGDGDRPGRPRP